jgi:multisubunit Na+/H+ antiporter MnhC subunit
MRCSAIILTAIIFATLAVALYGWYRHLRDDEDDLV